MRKNHYRRYKSNYYKNRRNRIMIAKILVCSLCLVGALGLILGNQKKIIRWFDEIKENASIAQPNEQAEEVADIIVPDGGKLSNETMQSQPEEAKDVKPTIVLEDKPTPAVETSVIPTQKMEIHGAYFTAGKVSNIDKVDAIIESLHKAKMNAVVFDIKDATGQITFEMDHDLAKKIGAISHQINDIDRIIERFHKEDIYVIGRVVTFCDRILGVNKPKYAVKKKDGTIFKDGAGDIWLDPYNKDNWAYLMEIAINAAKIGFDEIQFDYVRFSTEAKESVVKFQSDPETYSKTDVITDFIKHAVITLHPYGIAVSADVFGTIINSKIDSKIVGQDYVQMSKYLDYICPMVYPSHYGDGCYNLEVPDLEPYRLILGALDDSNRCLSVIGEANHCAIVRPWLQDFTAKWKKSYQKYGVKQVDEQIKGVYDSGYTEWLLWNSTGSYSSFKE